VSAERLVQAIREHGHHDASYVADKADLPELLRSIVRPGDMMIALGAGDVNASVRDLRVRLEAKRAARLSPEGAE
jgi:UDP-N-acetylmuramate--alanine ligase